MAQAVSRKISEWDALTRPSSGAVYPVSDGDNTYRVPVIAVGACQSMAELRAMAPVNGAHYRTAGFSSVGDGGGGTWRGVTGAAPGTYLHDGGCVIVPAGGNGSAAWIDADPPGPRPVQRWGVKSDGVTNDSAAMQLAVNAARLFGLELRLPQGTTLISNLAISGAAKPWALRGAGKLASVLKRVSGGTAINCSGSDYPFVLSDFTLDCAHSTVPSGSNHGISIGLVSGVRVERVRVIDHFASAVQIYDDAGTHRFFDNWIIDCDASGSGGNGQDGFLIANMDRCGIVRCFATG